METAEARIDGLIFLALYSLLKKMLFLLLFKLATLGGSLNGTVGILMLDFSSPGMPYELTLLSETIDVVPLFGFPKSDPCFPCYGLIVLAWACRVLFPEPHTSYDFLNASAILLDVLFIIICKR